MKNVETVLKAAGLNWENVVKMTVMYTDIDHWPRINEVYKTKFEVGKFPARTAFHSKDLPLGTMVEMEGIAVVKK